MLSERRCSPCLEVGRRCDELRRKDLRKGAGLERFRKRLVLRVQEKRTGIRSFPLSFEDVGLTWRHAWVKRPGLSLKWQRT